MRPWIDSAVYSSAAVRMYNTCIPCCITLCPDILWQQHLVLTTGINTTTTVSTYRRMRLISRLLVMNARQWVQIWPASAIKQSMILCESACKRLLYTSYKCHYAPVRQVELLLGIRVDLAPGHIVFSVSQNPPTVGMLCPFSIFVQTDRAKTTGNVQVISAWWK